MQTYDAQRQSIRSLRIIGVLATIWWGISGLYVVLWVWIAREGIALHGAWQGMTTTFRGDPMLPLLLGLIVLGWTCGLVWWLELLKTHGVRRRTALKDLFLTIRR